MAVQRDNYELFLQLLGKDEFTAQARATAQSAILEIGKILNDPIAFGGGDLLGLKGQEAKLTAFLNSAQERVKIAKVELSSLLAEPNLKAANAILDRPISIAASTGEPNKNEINSQQAALRRAIEQDAEGVALLLNARRSLVEAIGGEAGLQGQLNVAMQRRIQAEYKASEEGQQAATASALQVQRERGQAAQLATETAQRAKDTAAVRKYYDQQVQQLQEGNKAAANIQSNLLSPEEKAKYTTAPTVGTTDLERAQVALAQATSRQSAAQTRISDIFAANYSGELNHAESLKALDSAYRQLTSAAQQAAVAEERITADSGGLFAQFGRGFKGAADRPYAEQIGQAVKFSIFYGTAFRALSTLTNTLRESLDQGIAFQQGLADMAIATGRPKESLTQLGNQLAQLAADAGASPAAGLEIGARSVGLYGATQAPAAQQDLIATTTTNVVSKIAFGTKDDVVKVGENLAAITQALGTGAAGQVRIADLDAYLSKRFGVQQGSTIQAGAESAVVGTAAGFTIEQIQAMAAAIISRTGQDPTAVGGYLAQIYSRGGRQTVNDVAQRYDVQTTGRTFEQIFTDLAAAYKKANASDREVIAGAFGRGGKIENAVTALFQALPQANKASRDATGGKAQGALDKNFEERITTIGGQLALLSGHFKEFALLLGESGVLDVLGAAVKLLDSFLKSVNSVLLVFDQLPHAVRDIIEAAAALALANKLGIAGGFAGVGGRIAGSLSAVRAGSFATAGVTAAELAGGAEIGAAGAGLGALAGAAADAVGPLALAVGGIYAFGSVMDTLSKQAAASKAANEALYTGAPAYGSPSEAYRSKADHLDLIAKQARDATGWVAQAFTFGHADDAAQKLSASIIAEANRLRDAAKEADAFNAAHQPTVSAFNSFSTTDLTQGLNDITTQGGSTVTQLHALTNAIFGLGAEAKRSAGTILPKSLATTLAGSFGGLDFHSIASLGDAQDRIPLDLLNGTGPNSVLANQPLVKSGGTPPDFQGLVRGQLTGTVVQDRLQKELKKLGVSNFDQLTPADITEIANTVGKLSFSKDDRAAVAPAQLKALQSIVTNHIARTLAAQAKTVNDALNGTTILSGADAASAAKALADTETQRSALRPNLDFAGRLRDARQAIAGFKHILTYTAPGANTDQINLLIKQFQQTAVQTQIDRLEAQRKAFDATTTSQAAATANGRRLVAQEISAIVHGGGSADQLAAVLATAGKGAILLASRAINDAIKIADAAAKAAALRAKFAAAFSSILPGYFGNAPSLITPAAPSKANGLVNDLTGLLSGLTAATPSSNPDQLSGSAAAAKDTAEEVHAAQLAAEAARRGGQVGPARAALAQAKAELDKAKGGTVAYYSALGSYYQAQQALADAITGYQHILRELRIDTTNPVAEANLALNEARRKLNRDIAAGKAPDLVAQDKLDVKNAQNAAEAARFTQRLQDVQTAEQLGRISHGAYIQYLESEHNRLTAIAKKTRQQKDELNQIDQLIKDANGQLQGQFNIGDIKLPTPYEVRRYIKTQAQSIPFALTGAGAPVGGTTTIYINGADTGAVKAIIADTVGRGSRVLTTATRRN